MKIIQLLFASSLLILSLNAHAGGEPQITGRTLNLFVEISDEISGHSNLMIQVSGDFDDQGTPYTKVVQLEPFSNECEFTKDGGMLCRKDGKTVLAGTTYKLTMDTNPYCPGPKDIGSRLTCIQGCKKGVPKYLYTRPYGC